MQQLLLSPVAAEKEEKDKEGSTRPSALPMER
jgi:hypothetical protein